jgi:hypothetical protein
MPSANGDSVHGACAGALDRRDVKPFVFEQLVEHTPGERTMRTPALQTDLIDFVESLVMPLSSKLAPSPLLKRRRSRLPRLFAVLG